MQRPHDGDYNSGLDPAPQLGAILGLLKRGYSAMFARKTLKHALDFADIAGHLNVVFPSLVMFGFHNLLLRRTYGQPSKWCAIRTYRTELSA